MGAEAVTDTNGTRLSSAHYRGHARRRREKAAEERRQKADLVLFFHQRMADGSERDERYCKGDLTQLRRFAGARERFQDLLGWRIEQQDGIEVERWERKL